MPITKIDGHEPGPTANAELGNRLLNELHPEKVTRIERIVAHNGKKGWRVYTEDELSVVELPDPAQPEPEPAPAAPAPATPAAPTPPAVPVAGVVTPASDEGGGAQPAAVPGGEG